MEVEKNIKIYNDDYEISENDEDPNFLNGLDLLVNNAILTG